MQHAKRKHAAAEEGIFRGGALMIGPAAPDSLPPLAGAVSHAVMVVTARLSATLLSKHLCLNILPINLRLLAFCHSLFAEKSQWYLSLFDTRTLATSDPSPLILLVLEHNNAMVQLRLRGEYVTMQLDPSGGQWNLPIHPTQILAVIHR